MSLPIAFLDITLSLTLSGTVKVCLFLITWVILWLPLAWSIARKISWQPFSPLVGSEKLLLVISLYLTVPLLVWLTISVEGTSVIDYGLKWQLTFLISLLLGIGLGIAGLGILFGLEGWFGWLIWQKNNLYRLGKLGLPLLGLGLWVGITEELIFRGVLLNLLQQDYSLEIAAIISSGVFALLHLLWEREETIPQLPGLWIMGMILVWARIMDEGSLALASGLHVGWIWGLSCIDAAELISYTDKGAAGVVGWKKQPLARISGILCLLGTGLVLWQFSLF
ncbi:MAG: lysostaphin resistance A-like protein [cyanobacterium endosymbiont of Rhopalodia musculus]|uniref:CPBP family intramembrane glutamic endopeptidase n=1 Tax=cyanobacterium endosymbiont of Epithemia clementina EcSB TaxID=3034674 RepID=UPI00248030EA|nr:CPBP family intramembrane glutamic endopeptidase [cyanobacterium endosymbiont of Epithemia clementina EcSB]WGT67936.1 CPBP family intramembrane metalloprotease [cyanobacterium endosymbiont of Epithemia clementina EcSB]